jgi:hypothetical protein
VLIGEFFPGEIIGTPTAVNKQTNASLMGLLDGKTPGDRSREHEAAEPIARREGNSILRCGKKSAGPLRPANRSV